MDHKSENNTLGLSWHDTAWLPHLNQATVLDYFSERSNPFYDRTCNNETIKMQRLNPDQMLNMTGLEYSLLHAQEPILYVIRKQHRHSSTQVTPLADYYILDGTVYQGPDLCTVVNSRLLNTLHNLQSAFDEALTYGRFHPSRGYSWEFKEKEEKEPAVKDKKVKKKEEASSKFQRQRVDLLLGELAKKHPPLFPPPAPAQAQPTPQVAGQPPQGQPQPPPQAHPQLLTQPPHQALAHPPHQAMAHPPTQAEPAANGSMRPPPEKKQKLR